MRMPLHVWWSNGALSARTSLHNGGALCLHPLRMVEHHSTMVALSRVSRRAPRQADPPRRMLWGHRRGAHHRRRAREPLALPLSDGAAQRGGRVAPKIRHAAGRLAPSHHPRRHRTLTPSTLPPHPSHPHSINSLIRYARSRPLQSDHLALLAAYATFDSTRGDARFAFARPDVNSSRERLRQRYSCVAVPARRC